MKQASSFTLGPGWRILLKDLGIEPGRVLRRAALPGDLLNRDEPTLDTPGYFGLWQAIADEADDPLLPLRIGQVVSAEVFDPPIFAALCSPNLSIALQRLSRFKPLIGPVVLRLTDTPDTLDLDIEWLHKAIDPPAVLVATELVFFVQLARMATRADIRPLGLTAPAPPSPVAAYTEYFGVEVRQGPRHTVTFSAADAGRPFLTDNPHMWTFFEPQLQQRLSRLDQGATSTDRVRGALLELLPSGQTSMTDVSKKLAVSTRTLQRRLGREGETFQKVLNTTRKDLASHYLKRSSFSGAEISLLLGFEDTSSFFRAFKDWTGETPERFRAASA